MKYCPHCGASLPGGTVSFCPECGKKLPKQNSPKTSKKKRCSNQPARHQEPKKEPKNPMDVNYDGYYNDVPTIDADEQGDRMDSATARQIVFVLVGAVCLIIASVILMSVL